MHDGGQAAQPPQGATMTKTVREVMTPLPSCISARVPLREAHRMMQAGKLRHLPVLDDEQRLAGVVSERDLLRLEPALGLDRDRDHVSEAMSSPAFWVVPETPVAVVAAQMRARGIGAAVIVEEGKVVGIFTRSDALDELATPHRPEAGAAKDG